jgi:cytochrome c553
MKMNGMRRLGLFLMTGLLLGGGAFAAQGPDPLPYWANIVPGHTGRFRIVETSQVPRTAIGQRGMRVIAGRREPIGKRIIEVPESRRNAGPHDVRIRFVAYVPRGAMARGKKLVESGAGAFPCAACHGPDYKGDGAAPALAGRSPSGLVRQLYDFQHGVRRGPAADMMKSEVANMTADMRLDIAAYLASLTPQPQH